MKPWTPDDIQQRLAQLMQPSGAESDSRARTRLRILDAAAEHFARFGYRRASVGEIARDAGVGKGTLYLYFDSKQTLLLAALAREKLTLLPSLTALYALPESEQLEAYLKLSVLFVLEAPISSALLRGDRELEAVFAEVRATTPDVEQDQARGHAMLVGLLAGAAPQLSEAHKLKLAHMLTAIARLPAHLSTMDGLSTGMSNEEFATTYAKILALGIAALEPAS